MSMKLMGCLNHNLKGVGDLNQNISTLQLQVRLNLLTKGLREQISGCGGILMTGSHG